MATTPGSEASINFGKGYHFRPAGLDRPPLAGFPPALPARSRPQHHRDQRRTAALESPVLKCSPKNGSNFI